ncbi:MAG: hypothetical protein JWM30_393 [Burkholderia sp.]|nr:hypothetical protein [Burkholderia sp.]
MLWLLLAALPLQGFAAAMQLSCGPTKHAVSLPAPVAAAAHAHQHDAHPPTRSTPDHDHDHSAMGKHAGSTCSACLACCIAAIALPSCGIMAPVYSASVPAAAASPLLLADFIPGGPERPPKRPAA